MNYMNLSTGEIITEHKYLEYIKEEYADLWENDAMFIVEDMKKEGKTLNNFIEFMLENDTGSDFVKVGDVDIKATASALEIEENMETIFTLKTMKAMQEFADRKLQQELELLNDVFNLGICVDTYKELGIEEY